MGKVKHFIKERLYDYRSISRFLKTESENPHKPNLSQRFFCLRHGFISDRYEVYDFAHNDIKGYLPDIYKYRVGQISEPFQLVLDDKNLFSKSMAGTGTVPYTYGNIYKKSIHLDGKKAGFSDLEDFVRLHEKAIIKLNDDGGGKGVYLLTHENGKLLINGKETDEKGFQKLLDPLRKYIISEYINQADYAKTIYPGSTNTIRMITFIDPDNDEVVIPVCVHRFGTDESVPTDNTSQGGIACFMDPDTGIMKEVVRYVNKKFVYMDKHPNTGVKLVGYQVPRWEEIKDELIKVAREMDFLKYVGWDVVVTNEGIKILEGNRNPDFMSQIFTPYLANKKMHRFFEYHKIIR